MRYQKYHASKTIVDGISFDSRKEANRWKALIRLEEEGKIHDLERQVPFELTPPIREPDSTGPRGGKIKGKLLERASYYVADFVYTDSEGNHVVEDVKSPATRTPVYILKRKIMLWRHGIQIKEV